MILRRLVALLLIAAIGVAVAALAFDVELPLVGGEGAQEQEELSKPPALTEATTVKEDGLTVGWPEDWSQSRERASLRLQSPDRAVAISVSAPAIVKAARGRRIVLNDALKAIRRNYTRVRVTRGRPGRLDGYPTAQAVVSARNRNRVPVRILVIVAWRKRLAYLVEVFSAENAPGRRLVEAQTILSSVRLTK